MGTNYLGSMEMRMPPGFRFHPRDEELINDYLAKKLSGESITCPMLVDVDLNKVEPWDLPEEACVGGKEWYFYCLRDRKYATGHRTNRATLSGYWKATGKDRSIEDGRKGGRLVGMRKTLVFYQGRAPKGKKTDWVMHEFRVEPPINDQDRPSSNPSFSSKEDWVLCKVSYKSRCLSMKPINLVPSPSENCYDDTSSSSLPPLVDTFINFEQPHLLTQQGLYGTDHVPCFSSLISSSSMPLPPFRHRLHVDFDLDPVTGLLDHHGKIEGSSESFLTKAGGQSVWTSF